MASGFSLDQIDEIRNGPAATPPPGVIPDYENRPNNNRFAIAVIVASIVITALAVLIRFCSKVFCTRKVKLEDYIGLASFPFFIAGTWVLITIPRESGFFIHQWNLPVRDLEGFIYSYVLSTTLYCVTLLLAKAAILLEWTHLFVVRSNRNILYWTCYAVIGVNTALYIATIIAITFACNPRERIWRRYLPGTCIDINFFNIFITVFHLMSDIVMLLLPQMVIWKLRLAPKQKIGVSAVFSGGALACIWAAGRVTSAVHLSSSQDTTYAYSLYIIWGLAEVATAQIVFCIPAFPAIFRKCSSINLFTFLLSKMTMITAQRSLPPNSSLPQLPTGTDSQAVSDSKRTGSEDVSNASLAELEPARVQDRYAFDGVRNGSKNDVGGILVTTKIDITIHERTDSLGKTRVKPHYCSWPNSRHTKGEAGFSEIY